ncbi:MAG: class I tRNA ligase family protein, partial [bacterium]|nr:class I tRNA ligase family protein [bacterium]
RQAQHDTDVLRQAQHDTDVLRQAQHDTDDADAASTRVTLSLSKGSLSKGSLSKGVSVLIWTTTPWTLPANVAIALRADAAYGLYELDGEGLVLATALAPSALGERFAEATLLATTTGEHLDGLFARHPFLDRDSAIVLADYVDLETGTGAVHTAPGHGADDFETGIKYDLPILNPVNASGHFTDEAGPYAGQFIFKANKQIVEDLRASGRLWRAHEYEHSYPHCWRCHNPVIFRATAQWFIAMDQNRLRARAIESAEAVAYTPEWGETRLKQMLENHPEWCISRQRTWGTPIPALVCTGCGESVLDAHVARNAAKRFAQEGAGVWWSDPVETYLPDGFACPNCGKHAFEKEKNIVDIWFESGVTHFAVLGKDGIPWPSDLVLEGGDQYRGWFRSSLVTAVAVKNAAPYKRVVKNGWVNDEHGRPMSKSKGTGIDAKDAMDKWGADVLRLWAASVEFVDDVRFGPNVVEQVSRVYRNIRNRIRFMLSNLDDFGAADVVSRAEMQPLDTLACSVVDAFVADVKAFYDAYDIHGAYLRIVEFESTMSSLYFDALKDPLYSRAENDARRRSAQSALLYALQRFLTAVAPVLSFTAEEAWQEIPAALRGEEASVFDSSFAAADIDRKALDADLALWEELRSLRSQVAGSPNVRDFEAKVRIAAGSGLHKRLAHLGDNLREALVVSECELVESASIESDAATLEITNADGEKCRRCWKFRHLGSDAEHPSLCGDCAAVVRAL